MSGILFCYKFVICLGNAKEKDRGGRNRNQPITAYGPFGIFIFYFWRSKDGKFLIGKKIADCNRPTAIEFEVKYQPAKENKVADALSRNAEEELLEAISGPSWAIWEDIRTNLEGDPRCKENMEKRAVEQDGVNNFEMKDGLLLCKGRVVVPNKGELRKRVIEHFHDSKEGGHSALDKATIFCFLLLHVTKLPPTNVK